MQIRKLIINMFKNGDQHRGLIYLLISLFFFFIITIPYSFVERGGKVTSTAVVPVVVVILRNIMVSLHSMVCRMR